MKCILLFCGARDDPRPASSPEEVERTYADVGAWLTRHGSRIGSIHQLQPPDTATTVLLEGQRRPIVKDGPFLEGKELVGGYCEIDVADLDEGPTRTALSGTTTPSGSLWRSSNGPRPCAASARPRWRRPSRPATPTR
jgi:hypothetical protein